MGTTTTYDVLLRYRLDNKATADAERLHGKLGEASHGANQLGHTLGHLGAIAGGYMGIHGAWEHLVKFNAEVENAKISLAAMVEGGFGGSFEYAKGQAESLYKEFQKFSTQTPMTTQEMMEFGRGVFMATQQAGGSIHDVVNITEQGAVAAKALGFEAHMASREIAEMLQGNISSRMPFVKVLQGMMGKSMEELRAMTAEQRMGLLKNTLNSPAMKDAVSSMSQSFSGVTSTLSDKIQILLGKVGLPLFRAITAEVSRWNEWIDKNNVAIEEFAHTVGAGLVDAFQTVKDVFTFVYDHSDVFLAIGKTWAMIRVGNMIGGALGLAGGGGGGMLGNLGTSVSKLGGGALGPAMMAGVGSYELAKAAGLDKFGEQLGGTIYEWVHGSNSIGMRFDRLEKSSAALDDSFRRAAAAAGEQVSRNVDLMQGVANNDRTNADLLTGYLKALHDTKYGDDFAEATNRATKYSQALEARGIDTSGDYMDLLARRNQLAASAGGLEGKRDFIGGAGGLLVEALERSSLTEYQRSTLNESKAMNEVFAQINQRLAAHGSIFDPAFVGEILKTLRDNTADPNGQHKSIVEKPKVNVTIHRIEVQSDDPDRFAFRFVEQFRAIAKSPGQAASVLREG